MPIRASVVVPTYKRPDLLSRCLAALCAQDFDPMSYEVIVADDAAEPETENLVERWHEYACKTGRGPDFCYMPVVGAHGPAAARNRGWQSARGEIIAFTDDDCVPAPDWLRNGLSVFCDGTAAASGQVVVPLPHVPTDYERNAARLMTAEFITANCFIRRGVLEEIGGMDERFRIAWREDSDLFLSLLERDHKVTFAPEAIVVHPIRPAPWGISVRQQQRNLFNSLLYKKHRDLYPRWIQSSPRRRYYSLVGALVIALAALAKGPRLLALLTLAYWAWDTGNFSAERLESTSHNSGHVLEMLVTSVVIPPLAIYWRLRGALKWRAFFW